MANQALAARRRREGYHAPRRPIKRLAVHVGQIPMGGHLGRIRAPNRPRRTAEVAKGGYLARPNPPEWRMNLA